MRTVYVKDVPGVVERAQETGASNPGRGAEIQAPVSRVSTKSGESEKVMRF